MKLILGQYLRAQLNVIEFFFNNSNNDFPETPDDCNCQISNSYKKFNVLRITKCDNCRRKYLKKYLSDSVKKAGKRYIEQRINGPNSNLLLPINNDVIHSETYHFSQNNLYLKRNKKIQKPFVTAHSYTGQLLKSVDKDYVKRLQAFKEAILSRRSCKCWQVKSQILDKNRLRGLSQSQVLRRINPIGSISEENEDFETLETFIGKSRLKMDERSVSENFISIADEISIDSTKINEFIDDFLDLLNVGIILDIIEEVVNIEALEVSDMIHSEPDSLEIIAEVVKKLDNKNIEFTLYENLVNHISELSLNDDDNNISLNIAVNNMTVKNTMNENVDIDEDVASDHLESCLNKLSEPDKLVNRLTIDGEINCMVSENKEETKKNQQGSEVLIDLNVSKKKSESCITNNFMINLEESVGGESIRLYTPDRLDGSMINDYPDNLEDNIAAICLMSNVDDTLKGSADDWEEKKESDDKNYNIEMMNKVEVCMSLKDSDNHLERAISDVKTQLLLESKTIGNQSLDDGISRREDSLGVRRSIEEQIELSDGTKQSTIRLVPKTYKRKQMEDKTYKLVNISEIKPPSTELDLEFNNLQKTVDEHLNSETSGIGDSIKMNDFKVKSKDLKEEHTMDTIGLTFNGETLVLSDENVQPDKENEKCTIRYFPVVRKSKLLKAKINKIKATQMKRRKSSNNLLYGNNKIAGQDISFQCPKVNFFNSKKLYNEEELKLVYKSCFCKYTIGAALKNQRIENFKSKKSDQSAKIVSPFNDRLSTVSRYLQAEQKSKQILRSPYIAAAAPPCKTRLSASRPPSQCCDQSHSDKSRSRCDKNSFENVSRFEYNNDIRAIYNLQAKTTINSLLSAKECVRMTSSNKCCK